MVVPGYEYRYTRARGIVAVNRSEIVMTHPVLWYVDRIPAVLELLKRHFLLNNGHEVSGLNHLRS